MIWGVAEGGDQENTFVGRETHTGYLSDVILHVNELGFGVVLMAKSYVMAYGIYISIIVEKEQWIDDVKGIRGSEACS